MKQIENTNNYSDTLTGIIRMTIRDDSDFLSDFWSEEPVISSEAADYLDNAVRSFPRKSIRRLQIEIASEDADSFEKQIFTEAIHNYFENRLVDLRADLRRNLFASLILFIIGAVILAVMVILEHFGMRAYLSEIFDIIGWVFVWEATDEFCLERYKMKKEERNMSLLARSEIRFAALDPDSRKAIFLSCRDQMDR